MLKRVAGGIVGTAAVVGAGLAMFSGRTAWRVEAAVPPIGRFINIGGIRIHHTDAGRGPAIVMIHGLGGQLRNFSSDGLKALTQDFRVVALDRPGSGYSRRSRGISATLGTQAATIADFIRELGLHKPLVVGHSFGGAVALALALNHPDCVGGLALLSPLTHVQETAPSLFRGLAIRSPLLRRLAAWTLAIPASILSREMVLGMLFSPDPVPTDFALKNGALLNLRPSSFYSASSDMVAVNQDLPDMVRRYATLTIPVGILYGTGDRVLEPARHGSPMLDKIPGLDLELIEAGGHMIPVSHPERCAQFIRRIAGRSATHS